MTELDPTQPDAPAPQAPATPAIDVEAIKAELMAQFDAKLNERVSGIQSVYQKQLNERDEQIRQFQAASMSEEELEQLAIQEQEERVAALEAENWLLQQSQKSPKAAELFKQVLDFEDPNEQFAFFEQLAERLTTEAPKTPSEEPKVQVPDSDPNNPATFYSQGGDVLNLNGKTYTNDQIDDMLKNMASWPER